MEFIACLASRGEVNSWRNREAGISLEIRVFEEILEFEAGKDCLGNPGVDEIPGCPGSLKEFR